MESEGLQRGPLPCSDGGMVEPEIVRQIQSLAAFGWGARRIGRELGIAGEPASATSSEAEGTAGSPCDSRLVPPPTLPWVPSDGEEVHGRGRRAVPCRSGPPRTAAEGNREGTRGVTTWGFGSEAPPPWSRLVCVARCD